MTKETRNRPTVPHYTQGAIECIDAIRAMLTADEYKGFLKGIIVQYIWRSRHKGTEIGDILKARDYLNFLEDFFGDQK
jgi:hypothetical protein